MLMMALLRDMMRAFRAAAPCFAYGAPCDVFDDFVTPAAITPIAVTSEPEPPACRLHAFHDDISPPHAFFMSIVHFYICFELLYAFIACRQRCS